MQIINTLRKALFLYILYKPLQLLYYIYKKST